MDMFIYIHVCVCVSRATLRRKKRECLVDLLRKGGICVCVCVCVYIYIYIYIYIYVPAALHFGDQVDVSSASRYRSIYLYIDVSRFAEGCVPI